MSMRTVVSSLPFRNSLERIKERGGNQNGHPKNSSLDSGHNGRLVGTIQPYARPLGRVQEGLGEQGYKGILRFPDPNPSKFSTELVEVVNSDGRNPKSSLRKIGEGRNAILCDNIGRMAARPSSKS